jgi:hypothetical protein
MDDDPVIATQAYDDSECSGTSRLDDPAQPVCPTPPLVPLQCRDNSGSSGAAVVVQ